MPESSDTPDRGLSDALRDAVEKTVAEVGQRGREARESVAQRAGEARESAVQSAQEASAASAGVRSRVAEVAEGMRPVTRDEYRDLKAEIDELARRVAEIEAKSKPQVEG